MKNDCSIHICIEPNDLNKALKRPQHPMTMVEDVALRMPNATVFCTLDVRSGFWQIKLDYESSLLSTFNSRLEDFAFCACHLASLLPQKSSSVQWKSCLLGIPVPSSLMTCWYGAREQQTMMRT